MTTLEVYFTRQRERALLTNTNQRPTLQLKVT